VLLQEDGPPQRFVRAPLRNVVTVALAQAPVSQLCADLQQDGETAIPHVPSGSGADVLCGRHSGEALCN
jgi:hypothetical protein